MSKLKKILVRARRQVFSEVTGNNPSIFQGEGYDFVELREYMPGDDIRHIDWTITAKMQTPYIKIFKEERELNVVLATMLNGSVYFGSHRFKQDVIAEIVALLGFSVIKNGDLLSTYIFTDEMRYAARPTKKMSALQTGVGQVLDFGSLGEKADYTQMARTLYKRLKRRSLVILIGDFFEHGEWRVLAKKHEVIALVVRDRLEEKPPAMGFASVIDPETAKVVESEFHSRGLKEFTAKIAAHDKALFEDFRKSGIKFAKIYTDDVLSVSLRRIFGGS
jgi:uncharacterized protein (DUF58 family)